METVLYICASVALLALAGLFIFLITFVHGTKGLLGSVGQALQGLITEIGAIRGSLQGTVKNLEGIVGKVEGTVDRVNAQLDQVEGIVASAKVISQDVARLATDATDVVHGAKNIVVSVIGFVDNTQRQIQKPINEMTTVLSALSIGMKKFRMKLTGDDDDSAPIADGHLRAVDGGIADQGSLAVSPATARSAPSGIYAE